MTARVEIDQALTTERLDSSNRTLRGALPFTVVAIAFIVIALGDTVSPWRKALWAAVMTSTVLASFLCSLWYDRKRRCGPVLHWRRGIVMSTGIGFGWGALVLIAFPPADEPGLRAFILVFAVGISSVTLLSTAASRARYFAVNVPMTGILTLVYVTSGDNATRRLGLAIPLYFVVMTALHAKVHTIVMSNLRLRYELADLAMHDGLTGLCNRRTFSQVLEAAVEDARSSDEEIGVIYLDVDRFKSMNDRFGHDAGDQTLIEVGKRVESVLRRGDVCARLGGDEFAVLVRSIGGQDDLERVGDRILAALAQPFTVCGHEVSIAASVGYALYDESSDARSLLSASDAAQYRAKKAGGSRTVAFDDAMREAIEHELRVEADLRAALAADHIVPYFQPLFDLATNEPIGIEALARWVDPTAGVVPAASFLDVARGAGLMEEVDNTVVRQAMTAKVKLRELGLDDDFRLWINVDGHRIAEGRADRLSALLAETGCRPQELGIEITEREVLHDLDAAAALLRHARAAGIKIALDDFGTGHSSLVLLRRLPLDIVKIDRSFVAGVAESEQDRAIVALIVRAGAELGLTVVAEGIETREQADVLTELGCSAGQGYLLAKPMPYKIVHALLAHGAVLPA
jgi:diguanylate cyclase (GGDEF)-like protein